MRHIFLTVVIFILTNTLSGQKILEFESLNMDDGFSSSKANAIIQDRKGYIWVGTWNGLNRYDGYECKVYQPDYRDTTSISNREVVSLFEDHKGNIWIGTTSGLNCLNPETGNIRKYEFERRIISLYEDRSHMIWVGTWNGGLFKLDPETGQKWNYLSNDIISDIHEDSRNMFWVATYEGLVNLDRSSSRYIRYRNQANKANSISHSTVTQIEEDDEGNLWVGTWGGGLNKIILHSDLSNLEFVHYLASKEENSLASNVIYKLLYDKYDNLWIGSWDKGLSILQPEWQDDAPENSRFLNYSSDLSNPYSLSGNNITALYVDNSGVLWVGSAEIDYTDIIKNGISRYGASHLNNGNYEHSPVRAIAKKDSILYIGANHALKMYEQRQTGYENLANFETTNFSIENATDIFNPVLSILKEESGLWIGTDDAGLYYYPGNQTIIDKQSNYIKLNTTTNPALPGNKIGYLVASKKYPDALWVGTMGNGIALLRFKNDAVEIIETYQAGIGNTSLTNNNVRALVEDSDGMVWIGTQRGLNRLDPESKTMTRYFYSPGDTLSINDNVINTLHEDQFGNLWIGTNSGLNKKEVQIQTDGSKQVYFKAYPNTDNIDNEIITNILEDNLGNIWLTIYRGIVKFNIKSENVVKEYFLKEYQHLKANQNAAFKGSNGNFFIGGSNGFISFNPDSLLLFSNPPEVCITDLLLFNKSITDRKSDSKNYNLEKTAPYLESIDLSHKDRYFTVTFSAMDYKDPQKNEYSYILEGFDDNWNEVGPRNSATYTNLPPGNYVFKVLATNSHGITSREAATLKISVSTPWWRSSVAFIFYGLIMIGLLYFFKQYSIVEAKEKSRIAIEHLQNEKEHELNELKSQFFTNITHEFRTPLTLIMGPVEELAANSNLPKLANRQVTMIQRNAQRLLRLVNQLMEFRKVEKGKMEVFPQKCDISSMLAELYESFKGMAESKNIEFTLRLKKPDITAMVDYDKFERVLYNLLSNAFKYSDDEGKIDIRAGIEQNGRSGDILAVEVEDTGIGIAKEHQEKVFERFFQAHQKNTQSTGGIGLYLSKAFIELHDGEITLDSEPGKGSCFKVSVPLLTNETHKTIMPATEPSEFSERHESAVTETDVQNKSMADEAPEPISNKKIPHILIVEDDSELNEFICTGLADDFQITAAFNGREAFDLAKKTYPDIVVTDIMMPEINGIELCKLLRNHLSTSHIPVVFLTAKTMQEDEVEGLKIGAVDYIHKPFNIHALKLKITNILDSRNKLFDKIKNERLLQPEEIELTSLDDKFLKEAVNAVNDNIEDSNFNVEKFSHVMGISPNQVYRKIKALTGQTANEFIRNQRLKAAASLLQQKKRSISEIIYMVGFSSPSYFTRCFKDYYGCTPREYIDNEGKG